MAKSQIVKQGCYVEVAETEDGINALEKAMNKVYDLILMDIGLGDEQNGFEVSSQVKN